MIERSPVQRASLLRRATSQHDSIGFSIIPHSTPISDCPKSYHDLSKQSQNRSLVSIEVFFSWRTSLRAFTFRLRTRLSINWHCVCAPSDRKWVDCYRCDATVLPHICGSSCIPAQGTYRKEHERTKKESRNPDPRDISYSIHAQQGASGS